MTFKGHQFVHLNHFKLMHTSWCKRPFLLFFPKASECSWLVFSAKQIKNEKWKIRFFARVFVRRLTMVTLSRKKMKKVKNHNVKDQSRSIQKCEKQKKIVPALHPYMLLFARNEFSPTRHSTFSVFTYYNISLQYL